MPSVPPFFFNDTATTEIYTLSLHDALPISLVKTPSDARDLPEGEAGRGRVFALGNFQRRGDRKSTRLNSSHVRISYAVFCLKKKTTSSIPRRYGAAQRWPRLQRPLTMTWSA